VQISQNQCNDCNIDGHTEEKYWNLHLDLNSKNCKKDRKKNNPLSIDLSNLVESRSNVDENIVLEIYAEGGEYQYPSSPIREGYKKTLPHQYSGQDNQDICSV
jgi:hypothetical protein